jgi:HdeA/HdeB family
MKLTPGWAVLSQSVAAANPDSTKLPSSLFQGQCAQDDGTSCTVVQVWRTTKMKFRLISTAFAISLLPVAATAQVTIDMGKFTCGQYLAMSPSMSRDFSAWMSGWFSYQTRRTSVDVLLHQKNIANVKSWCQANPQASVMDALKSAIGPQ